MCAGFYLCPPENMFLGVGTRPDFLLLPFSGKKMTCPKLRDALNLLRKCEEGTIYLTSRREYYQGFESGVIMTLVPQEVVGSIHRKGSDHLEWVQFRRFPSVARFFVPSP